MDCATICKKRLLPLMLLSAWSLHTVQGYGQEPILVGEKAPEIRLADIQDQPFLLSTLKGKVVLVDFWASWCMPCRMSHPSLVKLQKSYAPRGLEVVSVSVDEDRRAWMRAVKTDNLSWTQLLDVRSRQAASFAFGVKYLPNSFLIDKKGVVRGVDATGRKLMRLVEALLSE
ncbi:MAG: TlpA family protein disulfide reductase [Bacteroidetes bacterium]|nr:TlpA family protein disulfide reductase [Bacteroidota bacterium]